MACRVLRVEFSRHARNGMRRLGISPADVERIVGQPEQTDVDPRNGKPRAIGTANGLRIRIVLGAEDHDFVVSVHERRGR